MAAKSKTQYACSECGALSPKWAGQCTDCGAWNTLSEVVSADRYTTQGGYAGSALGAKVQKLADIVPEDVERISTTIGEFDRVLGGGMVPGSVVLIGGDPGIGKSTILLQTVASLAGKLKALYVTGEESPSQVSLRARRLKLEGADMQLMAGTQVEAIIATADREKPDVMVIDSIQTMYTEQLQSAPGAVAQVRESAARLVRYAKQTGTSLFLVGHVTKEGQLAGPRVLEHMVDTVLYFEGDAGSRFRVVRAFKNRFGAVNELGVFAMTELGLKEVANPSALFLSGHQEPIPGSSIMVTLEGSRPLLVEVQALVDESKLGNPRRVTVGLEQNRLAILLAVLHRHGGIPTYDQDVFINVVGGVRVTETGADLATVLAIVSSLKDRPLPRELIVFGEIGLSGELRPVPNGQDRLREAAKHGFKQAIVPKGNVPKHKIEGLEVFGAGRLGEALERV